MKILPSEALYKFCGWLTTREEKTFMSATDDASNIAEKIKMFCEENKLKAPRKNWTRNMRYPREVKQ